VILREIRSLQQKEGRSLGRIISELLAEALARRQTRMPDPQLKWVSRPMRARVDLSDKEAVYALLDRDEH
jgi:hypothetical protein